jgi:preprotein translocase subunit SecE
MRNSNVKSKANVMVLKMENQESRLDWLKWLVVLLLLLAGVAANYYYSQVSLLLRTVCGAGIVAVSLFLISRTVKGKWIIGFIRDSRAELRKVVWPTREETLQTTLVVAAMVVVLALLLWGMDGILVWLIGWLTGQRG